MSTTAHIVMTCDEKSIHIRLGEDER